MPIPFLFYVCVWGGGGGGGGGGQFRAQSVISQTLPIYLDKQYTGWGRGGGGGGFAI